MLFSSSASVPLSFMTIESSSSQTSQAAQESQIPVPQPGPRATPGMSTFPGNEVGTAQQGMQMLLMPVSPKMGETAAWQQPQQLAPLYRQVPKETQVPTAQTPPMIDWADIRMKLAKERNYPMTGTGDIAMPVNYDAQGQNPRWERLDHEVVKDLIKAIRDNGLGSSSFKQLLKGNFNIYDLTPYDLRSLVSMILTDTQALVWDTRWSRALGELRARYQGRPNAALTMAQLAGDPPEDNLAQQAQRLPREVLNDIKEAVRKAILQVAASGTQDTMYTDISQGASESFSSFTDRLTQAVDRQVAEEAVKPHLRKSFAFANANQECKRVISAILGQPSLAEMVEACSKVGTPQHVASIVEKRLEERMERMFKTQSENFKRVFANFQKSNSSGRQCYKCGASCFG